MNGLRYTHSSFKTLNDAIHMPNRSKKRSAIFADGLWGQGHREFNRTDLVAKESTPSNFVPNKPRQIAL
jgi:hypothetical protein